MVLLFTLAIAAVIILLYFTFSAEIALKSEREQYIRKAIIAGLILIGVLLGTIILVQLGIIKY
jgi:hypothetical protein